MEEPMLIPMLDDYRPSTMPTKFFLSTNETLATTLAEDYLLQFFHYKTLQFLAEAPFQDGDVIEMASDKTLGNVWISYEGVIRYTPSRNSFVIQPTFKIRNFQTLLTCYNQGLVSQTTFAIESKFNCNPFAKIQGFGFGFSQVYLNILLQQLGPTAVYRCRVSSGATGTETLLFTKTGSISDLMVYNYTDFMSSPLILTGPLADVSFSVLTPYGFQPNAIAADLWMSF